MSLDKKKRPAADKVDCELAKRGVWLVKVPRYLSEQWEARAGQDVGRLIIKPPKNGKTDVVFKSRLNVARSEQKDDSQDSSDLGTPSESSSSNGANVVKKGESCEIPTEHNFIISDINSQTMAVLCEDKTGLNEDADLYSGKLNIEGRVVKRADCRPPPTLGYLKLKISQFEKSSQPKRQIQQIEKAEVKFKPIAIHMESVASCLFITFCICNIPVY
ncbi:hypothetical protein AB6A40_011129 [Gnathostoma spinigerum]|uniref:General transcription factor IIF subunit 2 n=1 Tax=Gnathostoma spinigerum TaxID=75299 RepID=A0ABD6F4B6_9BILA